MNTNTERPMTEDDIMKMRIKLRINAVREAYWIASLELNDFNALDYTLFRVAGITVPTTTQRKVLFDMLPQSALGSGISWGFNDADVFEIIHDFAEANEDELTERLAISDSI